MTIKFERSELAKILGTLAPYFTKGCPMAFRIIKGGTIEMFTTAAIDGGSVFARVPCPKSTKPTDWLHVDGPTFQQIISLADDGPIDIEISKEAVSMSYSPHVKSELRIVAGPSFEDGVKFCTPSAVIKGDDLNLIASMTEAASTDETRPNLHGIFISAGKKKLEAAAADGFILSFASLNLTDLEAPGAIYAVKALGRAKRAIKAGGDEDVNIGIGVTGIALSITRDNVQYTFNIPKMAGAFPDYKTIVKAAQKAVTVVVETGAFASFLKRATAIGGNVFMQVINGYLWFMAQNSETGEQCSDSVALPENGIEGPCMYYSHTLLKNTLKACSPNGNVSLTFPKANNSPMLIEGGAGVIAMPLVNPLKESPFKNLQPALI
jgi:hypothetical protein